VIDDVEIGMMSADALFWRCLHGGPLTPQTLDHPEPHPRVPWERLRPRNLAFLARMTERYGACAVLARDGDRVVGQLRFYPKAVFEMAASPDGPGLCLQQTAPNGPAEDFADRAFPPLEEMADRTLRVHCIMTGSPGQKENPYQRKGVGSRLVRALADWARERGWAALEVRTYADLPCLYAVTGAAGRTFWEKLGFRVVETGVESAFVEDGNEGFVRAVLKEAAALGMDADEATAKYTMRLDLA
jgi:hypothetical protein